MDDLRDDLVIERNRALVLETLESQPASTVLPWISVAPGAPYFVAEDGEPWHPIGHNDAICWPDLWPLFRRRDLAAVERWLVRLRGYGITCLRLMMEYAHVRHRYFERPAGRFVPNMVQLWDDMFALCERTGMRLLLTPFDTFWTWNHWRWHPYNTANGGWLESPKQLLTCPRTRDAIKARIGFAAERWGGSGALFAWDLWNEIHPAHADDDPEHFAPFIHDLSTYVRELEHKLYGRAHPQTVSIFGPEFDWKPWANMEEPLLRHPDLDFANVHIYATGTIDDPHDTVAPAIDMGRLVRRSLSGITDQRPFFDSEHGPIHRFKDKHDTLPEDYDSEYFRHMQWAHLASGGAGGGMRWPNRHPHVMIQGMFEAQQAMAKFMPLIDWPNFQRRNINEEIGLDLANVTTFGCADDRQAVIYLLRTDTISFERGKKLGMIRRDVPPITPELHLPQLGPGKYRVVGWDTLSGEPIGEVTASAGKDGLRVTAPPFAADFAVAIRQT